MAALEKSRPFNLVGSELLHPPKPDQSVHSHARTFEQTIDDEMGTMSAKFGNDAKEKLPAVNLITAPD